jgi:hypothetical protein
MSEAATKSTGVWGTLRTVVPRWNQKAPSPKDSRSAVQVTAAAAGCAVLDPPAGSSLERTSASRPAEQRERQQRQRGEHPAGDGPADFGYKRGLERKYRVLRELGRGGNGVVRVVEELATGAEWALKSIPKVLNDPKLSETCAAAAPCLAGWPCSGCRERALPPRPPPPPRSSCRPLSRHPALQQTQGPRRGREARGGGAAPPARLPERGGAGGCV